ncbi:MAG: Ppx/GppA family phosphatase [Deltaproteobacteria bacterium]|nr:Ppx/GppA family phosphatase [Deltaproteobacteria bacterium]
MSRPTPERFAAIDIGTNTILLTVAEWRPDGLLVPLHEEAHITRIGEGLAQRSSFSPAAMTRTLDVLRAYAATAKAFHVAQIATVGTAAFRQATNRRAFCDAVRKACGLEIQTISGEEEARLSFHAAAHDFGEEIVVLDIGGGSTECIWTAAESIEGHSFPLGSVTLQETYGQSDPISPEAFAAMQREIRGAIGMIQSAMQRHPPQLVALAGTATTLAAMHLELQTYAHDQVHGTLLSLETMATLVDRLRRATIAERKAMPGLESARADVILSGALLLLETMQMLHYDRVTISDRGVRWGLLYEAAATLA